MCVARSEATSAATAEGAAAAKEGEGFATLGGGGGNVGRHTSAISCSTQQSAVFKTKSQENFLTKAASNGDEKPPPKEDAVCKKRKEAIVDDRKNNGQDLECVGNEPIEMRMKILLLLLPRETVTLLRMCQSSM